MNLARDDLFSKMEGPIPGENYTSDTKNYPWHRAPDFSSMDEAVEYMMKKMLEEEDVTRSILSFLEMGVTVASLVDMLVTQGIGKGKWTPDFAILLAGPLANIICLMARGYDVPYDLGIKKSAAGFGKAYQSAIRKQQEQEQMDKFKKHSPLMSSILAEAGVHADDNAPLDSQPASFATVASMNKLATPKISQAQEPPASEQSGAPMQEEEAL